MEKFLVLYRAPNAVIDEWMKKPEQERKPEETKMMDAWKKWMSANASKVADKGAASAFWHPAGVHRGDAIEGHGRLKFSERAVILAAHLLRERLMSGRARQYRQSTGSVVNGPLFFPNRRQWVATRP